MKYWALSVCLVCVLAGFVGAAGGSESLKPGWTGEVMKAGGAGFRTEGTLLYAYARENLKLNGIPFTALDISGFTSSSNVGVSPAFNGTKDSYGSEHQSGDFGNVLTHVWYWNCKTEQPVTVTLRGLTAGKTYLVQLFGHRHNADSTHTRDMTFSVKEDGKTASAVICDKNDDGDEDDVDYLGGSLVGVFQATGPTKAIKVTYAGGIAAKFPLNAIQVRMLKDAPSAATPPKGRKTGAGKPDAGKPAFKTVATVEVPTAKEINEVMPQIMEITRNDLADVKSKRKTPVQAADALLGYIAEDDKVVTKFVLRRMAFEQLVNGMVFDRAEELYSTLLARNGAEYVQAMAETSRRKLYGFATPKYPVAKALMKRIADDEKAIRGITAVKAKIKKEPANASLYEQLAVEYIACDDWDSALAAFRRSSSLVSKIVKWELGEQPNAKYDAAMVAKFWWEYSDGYASRRHVCDGIKAYAANWYREAIAGNLLSGLDAKVATKRIEEASASGVKIVLRGGERPSAPAAVSAGPGKKPARAAGEKKASPAVSARDGLYMVVDLTKSGADAVSYLRDAPKTGWSAEYKTTKLVLRKIDPGSFEYLPGRKFIITRPYYIGVFEVTQKQYSLVMKSNPSEFPGDAHPVETVSYHDIRGMNKGLGWPDSDEVDGGSFLSSIRKGTGVRFELPTEAQWEYACRAGAQGPLNVKGAKITDLGRCKENCSKGGSWHEVVGSYKPNAWGLYDMLGNVWEWCVDRSEEEILKRIPWSENSKERDVDPVGPSTGSRRMRRGGCHSTAGQECTCNVRRVESCNRKMDGLGFRLACPAR